MAPDPAPAAGISKSLYSLCQGVPDRTQVQADFSLYHPGKHRACAPSGELHTISEHHHLHKPWREVVAGQGSEPVLPADWPRYIPPIDLLTAIKTQLQEEGVLTPQRGCTLNTQLGG